jgi:hypothetical protein
MKFTGAVLLAGSLLWAGAAAAEGVCEGRLYHQAKPRVLEERESFREKMGDPRPYTLNVNFSIIEDDLRIRFYPLGPSFDAFLIDRAGNETPLQLESKSRTGNRESRFTTGLIGLPSYQHPVRLDVRCSIL